MMCDAGREAMMQVEGETGGSRGSTIPNPARGGPLEGLGPGRSETA